MSRMMRILVMFDLPVKTAAERKRANAFRKFLIADGYHMLQFSVYARVCNGHEATETHRKRLTKVLPPNGSVRMLIITEKQFSTIELLVGSPTICDFPQETEQLALF